MIHLLPAALMLCSSLAPQKSESSALTDGAGFLSEMQLQDGSWKSNDDITHPRGPTIAITSACVHALAATGKGGANVQRGLDYILKNIDTFEKPYDHAQLDYNVWSIAFTLTQLHGILKASSSRKAEIKPAVEALIRRAKALQKGCGGWTYVVRKPDGQETRDGSVSALTATMLEGLLLWKKEGYAVDDAMIQRAVDDLVKSGGGKAAWPYGHDGDFKGPETGDGAGRTIQIQLALMLAGKAPPETLPKAIDAFFAVRPEYVKLRENGERTEPTMIAGYYYYFCSLHAARAIRKAAADPKGHADVLRKALLGEQQEGGVWSESAKGGVAYATAMVMLILNELRSMTWRGTLDDAVAAGRDRGRPVLVVFSDGKKDATDTEAALADPGVAEALLKFYAVRVAIAKDDPLCRKAKITGGSAILMVDGRLADPLAAPVKKWIGRQTAKALRESLEKAARDFR